MVPTFNANTYSFVLYSLIEHVILYIGNGEYLLDCELNNYISTAISRLATLRKRKVSWPFYSYSIWDYGIFF